MDPSQYGSKISNNADLDPKTVFPISFWGSILGDRAISPILDDTLSPATTDTAPYPMGLGKASGMNQRRQEQTEADQTEASKGEPLAGEIEFLHDHSGEKGLVLFPRLDRRYPYRFTKSNADPAIGTKKESLGTPAHLKSS
jgi:hypothetical protein